MRADCSESQRDKRVLRGFYLARELGVSRTPVGGAVVTLRKDGRTIQRRARLEVPMYTPRKPYDLYERRWVMDAPVAKLTAPRPTDAKLAALEGFIGIASEAEDTFLLWVADLRFHAFVYEAAQNTHFMRVAQSAFDIGNVLTQLHRLQPTQQDSGRDREFYVVRR